MSNTTLEGWARLAAKALERMAAADEHRNELLVADREERRAAWAASEERTERMAQLLNPVDWLADPDHDRLYWAIARANGRPGGSTGEDEILARGIIAELRRMVVKP
jgi:hypothetical protein